MSKTIKDFNFFKQELAEQYGYETWTWLIIASRDYRVPSEDTLHEEASNLFADYKAEQAYQRGRSEGYNKGYSDGLNAEELKF